MFNTSESFPNACSVQLRSFLVATVLCRIYYYYYYVTIIVIIVVTIWTCLDHCKLSEVRAKTMKRTYFTLLHECGSRFGICVGFLVRYQHGYLEKLLPDSFILQFQASRFLFDQNTPLRNLLAQRTTNIPKVWVSPSSFLFIFEAAPTPPSQTPISASLPTPPPTPTDHSLRSLGNDSLQCQWGAELLSPVINCLSNKNISLRYN